MVKSKRYLLDTHIFIWWLSDDPRLSTSYRKILTQGENTVYLSIASIWEMYLKQESGKLKFPKELEKIIGKTGFVLLPISFTHLSRLSQLPKLHKDPFDRILIAQAQVEKLVFITDDKKIRQYL
ncbi:TPA: PIN domain nuclease [Patescibacteria group bacterium]|uniref:PIN domain-containing protein n=1 Tax=Candidatus Gottesmanbacteria bacterium GW2011_GWA1_43_11 TaxID=1618436 RepID=A0A0G1FDH2_9BACT|nr:MAG: hypothetical protein UV59_C0012G0006 [Candidatus Gottesmanbacteria bacterium GW2011_GWA1_43_11]HCS78206.1 PIN domain nuclease [Patescibacteria group bacterium]